MQKVSQIKTVQDRKCSKQGSISGVCVEGIQDEKCSKEETLTILYGLSANTLTEKVSENPLKVRKMRQIMVVQNGKCSKQRDYVRLCIESISAKSV